MHITFIPGEFADKTRALCYNYIKAKYLQELKKKRKGDNLNDGSNLRAGEYRGTSEKRV